MSSGKQRSIGKEQFWRRLMRQWGGSGLSGRAFCEKHGLAEANFYAWRRTLAERDAAAVKFVPVRVTTEPVSPAMVGTHRTGLGPLELVLKDGRRLSIGPGFDGPTLQRLLALLEEGRP